MRGTESAGEAAPRPEHAYAAPGESWRPYAMCAAWLAVAGTLLITPGILAYAHPGGFPFYPHRVYCWTWLARALADLGVLVGGAVVLRTLSSGREAGTRFGLRLTLFAGVAVVVAGLAKYLAGVLDPSWDVVGHLGANASEFLRHHAVPIAVVALVIRAQRDLRKRSPDSSPAS